MSREEEPGNWSSWQSSWMAYRSGGMGQPQRGNSLGQSDSQILTLAMSSSLKPCCFIRLAKLEPKLQGLSSHMSSPFSPPMITSRQVMKSSGILPPKLALNLAKMAAKLVGEMCLAASILNPEKPMLNRVVKQSAILCLTYSVSVLRSARLTSQPQLRMKPSVQELSDLAQWKSLGPQGTAGSSIPGRCPVTLQLSQAKPCDQKGDPPLEFLLPQQFPPEQWVGNISFPLPTIWLTTASAYTLTPLSLQVLIIFLSCSGEPMRECSLQLTGWYSQYQGFSSPFSGCQKSRMASEGGNTFTPRQPALPIISHSSAMSSQGHPNISMIAPFCPFLQLLGWLTAGWFQMKSTSSRFSVAALLLPSQASTRTVSSPLKLLETKKELESEAASLQQNLRDRELQAGLSLVTTVKLAPPAVYMLRTQPTRMLQSWQLSLHRGSPLGGVWKARLLQEASLSVCCPRHAFSLSQLLQESLRREQEKGETRTAVHSSKRRHLSVYPMTNYKQSYQSHSPFMSNKVAQYLKEVTKMGKVTIIKEARKLGIWIKQASTREETLRMLQAVDHRVVEEYLERKERGRVFEPEKVAVGRVTPLLSDDLRTLRTQLLQIDRIYLNQYCQRYYATTPNNIPLPLPKPTPSLLDNLLGIRTQLFLNPKNVAHEYQYSFHQLQTEIFPTITEQGTSQPSAQPSSAKTIIRMYNPLLTLKDNLVLSYGLKKEKQFVFTPFGSIEEIFTNKRYYNSKISLMLDSINKYDAYYGQAISQMRTKELMRYIQLVNKHLDRLNPKTYTRNLFVVTLAEGTLRNEALVKAVERETEEGRYILASIYNLLRMFIKSMEEDNLSKDTDNLLIRTLKKYNIVKMQLLSSFPAVPEDVLVGTEAREWPEKLLAKLEEGVEEVGVGDLGGRRVVEKLLPIKEMIEFISQQGLEIGIILLERLLISLRSGIEWLWQEGLQKGQLEDEAMECQLQSFYSIHFCLSVIKMMFLSVPTTYSPPILDFLWHKFLALQELTEPLIQHLFLLINLTIRDKEQLLQDRQQQLYQLLQRSIEYIFANNLATMKSAKVLSFLKEEATSLLLPEQRDSLLHQLQLVNDKLI